MTGDEVIEKFHNYVDDELDPDLELQLVNDAKDEIEAERVWEMLKALDSTQTVTAGQTQSTTRALPTRFALPIALYVGDDYEPYTLINFEDQLHHRSNGRAYFIDMANNTYALTGTVGKTATINFFHTKYSADITNNTSWTFPERFHGLLPIKMAKLYYAIDGGEKSRAWDDRWDAEYATKYNTLMLWDAQLKMRAKKLRIRHGGPSPLVAFY